MKTSQYFSRKIKVLTADKQENLEAPLFEELSDFATSKIVGGFQVAFTSTPTPVQPASSGFLVRFRASANFSNS